MKLSKNKYYYLALCFISLYSLFNIFVAFSFGEILNLVKTSNYDKFLAIILKALLVILLLAISFYYKEKFKRKYLAGEVYNLSNRVFTSTLLSSSEQNSGKVISLLTNDIVLSLTSRINLTFVVVENIILLTFAILALLSQRLSLSLVVILAALILVNFPKLFKGFLSKYRKIQTENLSKFNNFISNSLGGFATIKDFSAETAFLKDMDKYGKEFEKSMVSSKLSINLANNIQYGFSFLIQIIIILLAAVLIHLGYLEIGSILIVGQLLSFVSEPIEEIVNAKNEDLANDLIIKNLGEVENKVEADGTIDKNSLDEKIELKNISLNFSSKQVFDKVNLTLVKGKKYALMGKSGSGKSTLFKLIKGEIKADKGKVLIDGVDINDLTRESKRNIFQAIGQDTFLFNGTIRHNIFLYDNFSEDKYREILQRVNMRATIEALAEKDMTIIGEKSQDLSGGQRQRIQVARGLIRDKDVYLFDEVTANLDEENANLLEETIKSLDKTVLAIRHRIDPSLRNYDYIIYIDKKKVKVMDYQEFIEKQE